MGGALSSSPRPEGAATTVLGADVQGGNFAFQRGVGKISLMQKVKVIAKQPPMPPAKKAAGDSFIGFGRRGHGGKSHAVQRAGQGGGE